MNRRMQEQKQLRTKSVAQQANYAQVRHRVGFSDLLSSV